MSGLHTLGQKGRTDAVVGAWFSGSDEAHAGIRAVRALQATYADVLKTHPDAAKYKAQVDPVVAAADKWDSAIVFYTNDDAVELGRRAEAISAQMIAEYGGGAVVHDSLLDKGAIERAANAASAAADTVKKAASLDLPWWVWGLGAVAVVGVAGWFAAPLLAPIARRAVGARAQAVAR